MVWEWRRLLNWPRRLNRSRRAAQSKSPNSQGSCLVWCWRGWHSESLNDAAHQTIAFSELALEQSSSWLVLLMLLPFCSLMTFSLDRFSIEEAGSDAAFLEVTCLCANPISCLHQHPFYASFASAELLSYWPFLLDEIESSPAFQTTADIPTENIKSECGCHLFGWRHLDQQRGLKMDLENLVACLFVRKGIFDLNLQMLQSE